MTFSSTTQQAASRLSFLGVLAHLSGIKIRGSFYTAAEAVRIAEVHSGYEGITQWATKGLHSGIRRDFRWLSYRESVRISVEKSVFPYGCLP